MEMNLQVPFLLLPGIFLPPLPRCAPWAGCGGYFSGQSSENHARRASCFGLDLCGNRRAKNSKAYGSCGVLTLSFWIGPMMAIFIPSFHRSEKPLHLKFRRTMSVHQQWRAHIGFANHVRNARNRKFEFLWIGKVWTK